MKFRRLAVTALPVALAIATAGCGGSTPADSPTTTSATTAHDMTKMAPGETMTPTTHDMSQMKPGETMAPTTHDMSQMKPGETMPPGY
jgi:hypothetical protein